MTVPLHRARLLSDFQVVAGAAGTVTVDELLSRLVMRIPDAAFDVSSRYSDGVVLLYGELGVEPAAGGNDPAMDCLDTLWDLHYSTPLDKPITLAIASEGGDVNLGLAIISAVNIMRRAGRKVNAHVEGYAFSMAALILQHCDHRSIEKTGGIMFHQIQDDGSSGSAGRRLNDAHFDERIVKVGFEIMAARTGRKPSYYTQKTDSREWYLTAKEALAEGLIDEILETTPFHKSLAAELSAPKKPRGGRKSAITPATDGAVT